MECFLMTMLAILLPVLFTSKNREMERLKAEKNRIERSMDRWEDYYRERILKLENEVDRLLKMKVIGNEDISADTIQAVKYAMKKSHPDNGGNAEDFIRFQKVYEELTKK